VLLARAACWQFQGTPAGRLQWQLWRAALRRDIALPFGCVARYVPGGIHPAQPERDGPAFCCVKAGQRQGRHVFATRFSPGET